MCHPLIRKLSIDSTNSIFKQKELKVTKRFTQSDLDNFSLLTGDHNYIHTEAVPVEKRKVHGALLNSIVAGIIGTKFPGGGSLVLEQTLSFPKPCRIEEECEFVLKLEQERKISIVSYQCIQNKNVVFRGEVKLLIVSANK